MGSDTQGHNVSTASLDSEASSRGFLPRLMVVILIANQTVRCAAPVEYPDLIAGRYRHGMAMRCQWSSKGIRGSVFSYLHGGLSTLSDRRSSIHQPSESGLGNCSPSIYTQTTTIQAMGTWVGHEIPGGIDGHPCAYALGSSSSPKPR